VLRVLRFLIRLGWPLRFLDPLLGRFNPFHPDRRRDPYPFYRALRESEPVHWNRRLRLWALSRHADVARVLRDAGFSVDRRRLPAFARLFGGLDPEFLEMIGSNLLMLDPPDHGRIRGLVSRAFTPRAVERLRPRVEALVEELLDAAARRREIDLVRDFAQPLPVLVIAELLGLPTRDRGSFVRWSGDLAALLDPLLGDPRRAQRAYFELAAYLRGLFAERRREPREDLVSGLLAAEERGVRLSETELLSTCALLLGAGHETTTGLIGNAVLALLEHPGERKRLRDDPGLLRSAVEEFLRYDPPVQATDRVAVRECEIGGERIGPGQLAVCLIGAANRDPEVFPEPDRLDLARSPNPHLSFGAGHHVCLGAPLARLEAELALGGLLRRFPDFRGDPRRVVRRPSITLRLPASLPLELA
jgi:hypothetical protein